MVDEAALDVGHGVSIPRAELEYRASRSGGPGGQHVNTSSTRIELLWNVAASGVLSEDQRARIRSRLAGRIDGEGVLRVVASTHRSQLQNRQEATERLRHLVALALRVPRRRRKTRPPPAAREARLRAKKHRSDTKRTRRPVRPED
jgi:ribosome-associated protein